MPDVKLKLIIDGKEAVVTLQTAGTEAVNLEKKLGGIPKTTGQIAKVSKRDLGIFTSQILDSVGATGKLAGQLNNVATGLLLGGGIGAAFAGFAAIINILSDAMDEQTEKIKQQKEELKKLASEYTKLTGEQIKNRLSDLESQLAEFEAKHPSGTETRFSPSRILGGQSPLFQADVSDEKRFGSDYLSVKLIKERISLLDRELLYKGKIDEANIRIGINQEKLNRLSEKNFALIVSGAESYEDARKTIEKWIEADKKILGEEKKISKEKKEQLKSWKAIDATAREILKTIKALPPGAPSYGPFDIRGGDTGKFGPSKSPGRDSVGKAMSKGTLEAMATMKMGMNSFWDAWLVRGLSAEQAWNEMWSRMIGSAVSKLGDLAANAFFSMLLNIGLGAATGGTSIAVGAIASGLGKNVVSLGGGNNTDLIGPLLRRGIDNRNVNITHHVNVSLRGNIRKSAKDFVVDFENTQNYVNKTLKGKSFDRS